jgi:hypothetical protein
MEPMQLLITTQRKRAIWRWLRESRYDIMNTSFQTRKMTSSQSDSALLRAPRTTDEVEITILASEHLDQNPQAQARMLEMMAIACADIFREEWPGHYDSVWQRRRYSKFFHRHNA